MSLDWIYWAADGPWQEQLITTQQTRLDHGTLIYKKRMRKGAPWSDQRLCVNVSLYRLRFGLAKEILFSAFFFPLFPNGVVKVLPPSLINYPPLPDFGRETLRGGNWGVQLGEDFKKSATHVKDNVNCKLRGMERKFHAFSNEVIVNRKKRNARAINCSGKKLFFFPFLAFCFHFAFTI